jgi:hypothetical protein
LDNLNDSKDNCAAEVESDIVQGNGIDKLESPEQWDTKETRRKRRMKNM